MNNYLYLIAGIVLVFTLVGCRGEPSVQTVEGELEQAGQLQVEAETLRLGNDLAETDPGLPQSSFETVPANSRADIQLKTNGVQPSRGLQLGSKQFVVEVIACNQERQSCAFRVNGVAKGALHINAGVDRPNEMRLDEEYVLKVNAIQFDYCDDRRICDYRIQAYDVVDVSVIPTDPGMIS